MANAKLQRLNTNVRSSLKVQEAFGEFSCTCTCADGDNYSNLAKSLRNLEELNSEATISKVSWM